MTLRDFGVVLGVAVLMSVRWWGVKAIRAVFRFYRGLGPPS